MNGNEHDTKAKDKSAELNVTDAGRAKAEPQTQELTDKELGAVVGGNDGGKTAGDDWEARV